MITNYQERQIRIRAIASIVPTIFCMVIILISIVKQLTEPHVDPLDVGLDKIQRIAAEAIVVDSMNNGFKAIYATVNDVTPARHTEIVGRPHIRERLDALKKDAPAHFGNMLNADIYDFTIFVHRYHPDPDLVLHNVFVFGREKMNLYIGPNPGIKNPATWIDHRTLQGVLYIGRKEISRCTSDSVRVYRYWKCRTPFKQSETDEHFSHFSEDDRLYD